jgi:uncharacterized membrane protein YccC
VSAWDEGNKIVERAKLFSGGAFVLLLLVAIYAFYIGSVFDGAYFAVFSIISLGLYFWVKRILKVHED